MLVKPDGEPNRARRYLLGEAGEEERAAIEQEYFVDEGALERIEATEEELIEDYLADRLGPDQRSGFERRYLAVPHRRRRVDTIRSLMSVQRAAPAPAARRFRAVEWATLAAAALILIALGGWWMLRTPPAMPEAARQQTTTAPRPEPPRVTAPMPQVFAFSISPVNVRSAGDSLSLVVPTGTDVVRLQLEGGPGDARVDRASARVHTVTGDEVWRGSASVASDAPAGTIAEIDIPAERLRVDDYVVELFAIDASGREQERSRYFLRVRAR
jgi:hypothetical protein